MKLSEIPLTWVIGAAAILAGLAYVMTKKKPGETVAQAAGAAAAEAAVEAVGDVATGAVLGVGDAIGIPRTDVNECQRALAEGRLLDASFVCPAGDFIGGAWDAMTK